MLKLQESKLLSCVVLKYKNYNIKFIEAELMYTYKYPGKQLTNNKKSLIIANKYKIYKLKKVYIKQ